MAEYRSCAGRENAMKCSVFGTVLAVGFAAWIGAAHAQNFPVRPVTLIVPWPAGGTTDVGMRALASATEKHLGQLIVIENRPGGSGTLAPGQMAASAKPDGYTITQIPITVFRFTFHDQDDFRSKHRFHLHHRHQRLHVRCGGEG